MSRALRPTARCCHCFAFGPSSLSLAGACRLWIAVARRSSLPSRRQRWMPRGRISAGRGSSRVDRVDGANASHPRGGGDVLDPGPPPGRFSAPEPAHRSLLGVGRWIPPSPGCRGPGPPLLGLFYPRPSDLDTPESRFSEEPKLLQRSSMAAAPPPVARERFVSPGGACGMPRIAHTIPANHAWARDSFPSTPESLQHLFSQAQRV